MTNSGEDFSMHKIAKLTGFMFLFFIIVSVLHYTIIELNITVSDNTASIAEYIKSNEALFRIGIIHDLVIFISGIVLSLLLYFMLKSINKLLALFAMIMVVMQAALAVVIEFSSLYALALVSGESYMAAFETAQLNSLLGLFLSARTAGYGFTILFFCPGMIIFFYLFLKSEYIPGILAKLGILSYSLLLIWTLISILVPDYSAVIPMARILAMIGSLPVMLFQLLIGIWLISKGISSQKSS